MIEYPILSKQVQCIYSLVDSFFIFHFHFSIAPAIGSTNSSSRRTVSPKTTKGAKRSALKTMSFDSNSRYSSGSSGSGGAVWDRQKIQNEDLPTPKAPPKPYVANLQTMPPLITHKENKDSTATPTQAASSSPSSSSPSSSWAVMAATPPAKVTAPSTATATTTGSSSSPSYTHTKKYQQPAIIQRLTLRKTLLLLFSCRFFFLFFVGNRFLIFFPSFSCTCYFKQNFYFLKRCANFFIKVEQHSTKMKNKTPTVIYFTPNSLVKSTNF